MTKVSKSLKKKKETEKQPNITGIHSAGASFLVFFFFISIEISYQYINKLVLLVYIVKLTRSRKINNGQKLIQSKSFPKMASQDLMVLHIFFIYRFNILKL